MSTAVALYQPGTAVRIRIEVTGAESDDYVTPSAVALKIKDPAGTVTTYAIGVLTLTDVGRYYYDYTVPDAAASEGQWFVTVAATVTSRVGTVIGSFFVAKKLV